MVIKREQALAFAKGFYGSLPTCVFLCDKELQVLWKNESACRFDGETAKSFDVFLQDEQRDQTLRQLEKDHEIKFVRLLGEYEYVLCFRLLGDDYVVIEAERQSRSYLQVFMEDEESVMRLFTNVLRLPVGNMFNMISILQTHLEVSELYDDLEYIDMLKNNCYFVLRFMQNYCDYRRLLRKESKEEYVNLKEELFELLSTIQVRSFSYKTRFSFTLPEQDIPTVAPVEELNIAMLHLISNAFKYTSPGNEVSVRVDLTDRSLMIQVADQGVGIPPQNMKNVFVPFYSYNPNTSRTEGAGIGLAYVQRFVADMHGSCVVTSVENQGTRVALSIPLKKGRGEVSNSSLHSSLPPYYLNNFSPVAIYLSDAFYKE